MEMQINATMKYLLSQLEWCYGLDINFSPQVQLVGSCLVLFVGIWKLCQEKQKPGKSMPPLGQLWASCPGSIFSPLLSTLTRQEVMRELQPPVVPPPIPANSHAFCAITDSTTQNAESN